MIRAGLESFRGDALFRRMLKNMSYLLSGTAAASVLGFLSLALTARALGPELLGVLTMIQAYTRLVDRGRIEAWPAIIKYGAETLEHRRQDDFKSLLKFGVLLDLASSSVATMIALVSVHVAGWWFEWSTQTIQMASLFSLTIMFRMTTLPIAVLRLFNRFGLDAAEEVLTAALRLLLVFLAYLLGAGLWTFVMIIAGTYVFSALFLIISGWIVLWREGYRSILASSCKGMGQRFPGLWSFIWSLNAGNIARKSTNELDTLIVGGVIDPAAAGLYQVAKRMGEVLSIAGIPIQQVLYPEAARLWARAEALRFRRTIMQINVVCGAIGVAALAVVVMQAERIITLAFGTDFAAAAGPMVLQTLAASVFLFGSGLRPALLSMGLQIRFLQIVTLSTVCFYIALFLAVPTLGIYGAPLAHLIYNLVWLTAMFAALNEGLK
ncbi:MAG: oligosaccharide flippase family protein, partial [Pseudomonadota bacterium]